MALDPIQTRIEIEYQEAQKEWEAFEKRIADGTRLKLEFDQRDVDKIGRSFAQAFDEITSLKPKADAKALKTLESEVGKSAAKAGAKLDSELTAGVKAASGQTIEFDVEAVGVEEAAREVVDSFEDEIEGAGGRLSGLGAGVGDRLTEGLIGRFGGRGGRLAGGLESGLASSLGGLGTSAGVAGAVAAVGVALAVGVGKAFQVGLARQDASLRTQLRTNLTDAETAAIGRDVGAIYGNGVVDATKDEIRAAREEVETLLGSFVPDLQLNSLTEEFLFASELYATEVETLIQQTQRFITIGLVDTAAQGLDSLTEGAALLGSRFEDAAVTLVEFGPVLTQFGIDGSNAFEVLNEGFASGAFAGADAIDRVAQTFQDFGDRLQAGGSREAIQAIGLSYGELTELLANGQGQEALQIVSERLLQLGDDAEAAALGSEIFGAVFDEAIDDRALLEYLDGLDELISATSKYEDFTQDLATYNASTSAELQEFTRILGSAGGQFGDLVLSIFAGGDQIRSEQIARSLGDTLNGVFSTVFDSIGDFIDLRSSGGLDVILAEFFDALFGTLDERAAIAGINIITSLVEPIEGGLNFLGKLVPGLPELDFSAYGDEAVRQLEEQIERSERRLAPQYFSPTEINRQISEGGQEVFTEIDKFRIEFDERLEAATADTGRAASVFDGGLFDQETRRQVTEAFREQAASGELIPELYEEIGISAFAAANAEAALAAEFKATNDLLVSQIPQIGDAISQLEEDATLEDFFDTLIDQQLAYAQEQSNFNALFEAGFDNLAATLRGIDDRDLRTGFLQDAAAALEEGNLEFLSALELDAEQVEAAGRSNADNVRSAVTASIAPINELLLNSENAFIDSSAFLIDFGFEGEAFDIASDRIEAVKLELDTLEQDPFVPQIEVDTKRREFDKLVSDLVSESRTTYTTGVGADTSAANAALSKLRADALGTVLRPPVEITPDVLALQREVAAADLQARVRVSIDTGLLQSQLNNLNARGILPSLGGFFDGGVAPRNMGVYRYKEYGLSEAIVPLERGPERAWNVAQTSGILDVIDPYLKRRYGGPIEGGQVQPVIAAPLPTSGERAGAGTTISAPITVVTDRNPHATADRISRKLYRR